MVAGSLIRSLLATDWKSSKVGPAFFDFEHRFHRNRSSIPLSPRKPEAIGLQHFVFDRS